LAARLIELSAWHGLKEGDEVELEIKEKARDGRGIGRVKGLIIFVSGASVGEKVRVRLSRIAARHAHAEVVRRYPIEAKTANP
jgi:23S rRNA (uracil1939-C5)-methyltransferase